MSAFRRFAADKMQKVNMFETPQMFCDVYCLEPGQAQKAHAHPVLQIDGGIDDHFPDPWRGNGRNCLA